MFAAAKRYTAGTIEKQKPFRKRAVLPAYSVPSSCESLYTVLMVIPSYINGETIAKRAFIINNSVNTQHTSGRERIT